VEDQGGDLVLGEQLLDVVPVSDAFADAVEDENGCARLRRRGQTGFE
jgi:hypothetical protein